MAQPARAKRAKRPTPIADRRRARKAAREACKAAQRELKTWVPAERKRVAGQIAMLRAAATQQAGKIRAQALEYVQAEREALAQRIKDARKAAKLGACVDRTAGPALRLFGPRPSPEFVAARRGARVLSQGSGRPPRRSSAPPAAKHSTRPPAAVKPPAYRGTFSEGIGGPTEASQAFDTARDAAAWAKQRVAAAKTGQAIVEAHEAHGRYHVTLAYRWDPHKGASRWVGSQAELQRLARGERPWSSIPPGYGRREPAAATKPRKGYSTVPPRHSSAPPPGITTVNRPPLPFPVGTSVVAANGARGVIVGWDSHFIDRVVLRSGRTETYARAHELRPAGAAFKTKPPFVGPTSSGASARRSSAPAAAKKKSSAPPPVGSAPPAARARKPKAPAWDPLRGKPVEETPRVAGAEWGIFPHAEWHGGRKEPEVTGQGYVVRPTLGAGVPYNRMHVLKTFKQRPAAERFADAINSGKTAAPGPYRVYATDFPTYEKARAKALEAARFANHVAIEKRSEKTGQMERVELVPRQPLHDKK
jgi:hypothetical protein